MKKSWIVIFASIWTSICTAQEGCLLVKDTFYLVTLDIRGNGINPILMSGVTNRNNLENLKIESLISLMTSFYDSANFLPDIAAGFNRMLVACKGDISAHKYLIDHELELSLATGRIGNNSRTAKFTLQSGEVVFVSVTTIGGSFWKVNKSHPGISKSSNSEDISLIKQIQECYVPFKIDYYKKPKKIKQVKFLSWN